MLDIVSGRAQAMPQETTIWVRSVDELSRPLSDKNINLLAVIHNQDSESINDLAKKSGQTRVTSSGGSKKWPRMGLF